MASDDEVAIAIVRVLIAIAHADGRLDDSEVERLRQAIASLPITDEERSALEAEFKTPPSLADAAARIVEPEHKHFVLSRALQVAYADGDYSQPEREKIEWLADELGVTRETLARLERANAPS